MTSHKADADGRLPQNIIHFCHALRRAGVPIGTAQIKDAVVAVQQAGFTERQDFYIALRSCLVTRVEHFQVFSQVFDMFWRDPEFLENMIQMLSPMLGRAEQPKNAEAAQTRAQEALAGSNVSQEPNSIEEELVLDARFSMSSGVRFGSIDFDQMTTAEMRDAERAIARMQLPIPQRKSRRYGLNNSGRKIDARAAFRAAHRTGGEVLHLPKVAPKPKSPDLVVLTDISGSMSTYSRMMLHFIHSIVRNKGGDWAKVHAFTFGTVLSNITRHLDVKDPDAALGAIGTDVQDWNGGTQIGESLRAFNTRWLRRVAGTDSVLLLITDGLERDDPENLKAQMTRLRLSFRQIIWLNPLLRFEGFAPRAQGVKAILPMVDNFVACHNLNSLEELALVLNDMSSHEIKEQMLAAI